MSGCRHSGNEKTNLLRPPVRALNSGTRCGTSYSFFVVSSAEFVVPIWSSRRRSEEHCFYPCGSFVLHVRKGMSISVQREGRAGVSELLRNNFRDTPAANAIVAAEWRKS